MGSLLVLALHVGFKIPPPENREIAEMAQAQRDGVQVSLDT